MFKQLRKLFSGYDVGLTADYHLIGEAPEEFVVISGAKRRFVQAKRRK